MIEASRYIFRTEYVRADGTVLKEAFLPPGMPRPFEPSVNLHTGKPIEWSVGRDIGNRRNKTLIGSAEFTDGDTVEASLSLSAAPSLENPNHAVIIGWDEIDDLHRREQADMLAERAFFVQAG